MRTILLDMTVCGFKCIDEPITIQFTNKTFNKGIYDSPQIKAIYGTNGEGKSALIHAIDVYIKTIFDEDTKELFKKRLLKTSFLLMSNAKPNIASQVFDLLNNDLYNSQLMSWNVFIF